MFPGPVKLRRLRFEQPLGLEETPGLLASLPENDSPGAADRTPRHPGSAHRPMVRHLFRQSTHPGQDLDVPAGQGRRQRPLHRLP